jgi:tetratricopeptide (TPR) repeat protein
MPTEQSSNFKAQRAFGPGVNLELELRARLARSSRDVAATEQLAGLLAQKGRFDEAAELLETAVECSPHEQALRFTLTKVHLQRGDFGAALDQIRLLRPSLRSSFEVQTIEAGALGMLGRHPEQVHIYKKLLRNYPTDPRLWERLGNALKYSGRTPEAVRAFQRSVRISPAYGEGWWALANVKTFRFDDDEIAAMCAALTGELTPDDAAQLNFALGKALEDRGDFETAFRHYSEGNRIKAAEFTREQMATSRLADFVDHSIATFNDALLSRLENEGDATCRPIFIVGLQRSGSTLIEQILASHPMIEGIAEPDAMLHTWTGLEFAAARSAGGVWQAIRELTPERLQEIAADYLDRVRPFRKEGRPLFVDKRPANWMYVGLIRLAFPSARIVDARRHPLACGFSNFKQHYAGGAFPLSYSLEGIGHYYAEYVRLMSHFDCIRPGSVHHVLNESLIDDAESEIRRLLEFVDVPFDPACLDFHETKRAVTTASAEQVRRPLNREGVEQWRNFEPWLDDLKKALGPVLENWANVPR